MKKPECLTYQLCSFAKGMRNNIETSIFAVDKATYGPICVRPIIVNKDPLAHCEIPKTKKTDKNWAGWNNNRPRRCLNFNVFFSFFLPIASSLVAQDISEQLPSLSAFTFTPFPTLDIALADSSHSGGDDLCIRGQRHRIQFEVRSPFASFASRFPCNSYSAPPLRLHVSSSSLPAVATRSLFHLTALPLYWTPSRGLNLATADADSGKGWATASDKITCITSKVRPLSEPLNVVGLIGDRPPNTVRQDPQGKSTCSTDPVTDDIRLSNQNCALHPVTAAYSNTAIASPSFPSRPSHARSRYDVFHCELFRHKR